jgi:hypothetical protein
MKGDKVIMARSVEQPEGRFVPDLEFARVLENFLGGIKVVVVEDKIGFLDSDGRQLSPEKVEEINALLRDVNEVLLPYYVEGGINLPQIEMIGD